MAWTTVKSGGWVKNSETTAIADTAAGANSLNDSSIISCKGLGKVMVKADEDATATVGITAKLYYSLSDGLNGVVGGIGADPSSSADEPEIWTEVEVGGALADNTLAVVDIPENAARVKVEYSADPVGGAISSHAGMATELWAEVTKSDTGFSVSGSIGADPS